LTPVNRTGASGRHEREWNGGRVSLASQLEPYKLIEIHRPSVDLKAVVAIDNIACRPAMGGVRMAPDVSTEKAFRLARAMTFKNAARLPHGGGKSVIFADPRCGCATRSGLIRTFATPIAEVSEYILGPDMGTDELAMGWIKDEIGRSTRSAPGFGLASAIDVVRQHIDIADTDAVIDVPLRSLDLRGTARCHPMPEMSRSCGRGSLQ
jgi:glutamate dehydrogenase (NAD(P)+)